MSVEVHHGDMLTMLPALPEDTFHAAVTDPPYHLTSIVKRYGSATAAPAQHGTDGAYARVSRGFMGKQWDGGDVAMRPETWAEVWRVLRPGAHLLAFAGTRTQHRMICAIEDAGFEVRDCILWLYGSGFPKSHDVSKGIDRAAGTKRPIVGKSQWTQPAKSGHHGGLTGEHIKESEGRFTPDVTAPATDESREWQGWGTALKPAVEIICVARKPLSEKTVAANVLRWGCGALNIDGCRVGTTVETWPQSRSYAPGQNQPGGKGETQATGPVPAGRWPANLIHDGSDEVLAAFAADGERPTGNSCIKRQSGADRDGNQGSAYGKESRPAGTPMICYSDTGTAARFFYSAKADATDRLASKHPTVKPLDLMRYLCRLVTPPRGLILDPFAGSGTTGMAAMADGFSATLIEREAEYVADIRRRIAHVGGDDTPLFADVRA